MITIPDKLKQFNHYHSLQLTKCWDIALVDNTNFYFTEHDSPLTLDDGNLYEPKAGLDFSAIQEKADLETSNNVEVKGFFDSAAITIADLRSGKFRNAIITQKLVSFIYPWLGPLFQQHFFIDSVSFTGEFWVWNILGIQSKMRGKIGTDWQRRCSWTLGVDDGLTSRCKFNLSADAATVSTIVEQRLILTASALAGTQEDDWYKYGYVTWTSGANTGFHSEILQYTDSTGTLEFRFKTPFDIEVGDAMDVFVGCDKLKSTCKDKFNQLENFGGFDRIPGTDAVVNAPQIN